MVTLKKRILKSSWRPNRVLFAAAALLCTLTAMAQSGHTTALKFNSTVHDFGKFSATAGPQKCTFTYTNVSNEPVVINNILSSCGCSVPEWDKAPIMPGKGGKITVTYLNDHGAYPFDKTLTVYVSSSAKPIQLRIIGIPYAKEKPLSEQFPVRYGLLGMKRQIQNGGQIEQGLQKALKENIVNLSNRKVKVEFEDVEPGLQITITPKEIAAGESATISYTIDTKVGKQRWGRNLYRAAILCNGERAKEMFTVEASIVTPYTSLTAEQKRQAAMFSAEDGTYMFGSAKSGEYFPIRFTISNKGKSTLNIYKVEASKAYMKINCPSKIAAGATATIEGSVKAAEPNSDATYIIHLITNDPDRPIVALYVAGEVK